MREAAEVARQAAKPRVGVRLGSGLAAAVAGLALLGGASPASACVLVCWTGPTTTTTVRPTTTTAPPAPLVTLPPVTVPPLLAGEDPAGAARLLDLANEERARTGLAALVSRDDVVAVALGHTRTMVAAGDIFHNDAYFGSVLKGQLGAVTRGENVAVSGSVDDIHARLMASPAHRANILNGRFTVAGIAVVRASDGQVYATEDFLQPRGGAPAGPAPAPDVAAPAGARPEATERTRSAPAPARAKAAPPTTEATPTTGAPEPEAPAEPPVEAAVEAALQPAALTAPAPGADAAAGGLLVGAGSALVGVSAVLARMARRRLFGV